MSVPQSIQTARIFLATHYSYVDSLLWALRPVESPGLGTVGVDRHWHLYYDPDIDAKWSGAEVLGAIYHEINHILRNHTDAGRAKPFIHCDPYDPKCEKCRETSTRFNICGDLEINPGVEKLGFQLPANGMFPKNFGLPDGLLAEEYWDKLPPDVGKSASGIGKGTCGSCAGNPSDTETKGNEDGDDGDKSGISKAERELIIRDVAKKIEDAAKSQGNVPAGLDRWAKDYLHPKVPWKRELRTVTHRQINECMGKREYTFKRPHRRQGLNETILPSMRDFFPRIGLVRDTSGSMDESDIARSIAETRGLLKEMGGEIVDIEVDCQVHAVKAIRDVKQVKIMGGGGTDMGVGILHACGLKPRLDIIIVITDGETPWPKSPPPTKVVVVLTREASKEHVPSWAKVIVVND